MNVINLVLCDVNGIAEPSTLSVTTGNLFQFALGLQHLVTNSISTKSDVIYCTS